MLWRPATPALGQQYRARTLRSSAILAHQSNWHSSDLMSGVLRSRKSGAEPLLCSVLSGARPSWRSCAGSLGSLNLLLLAHPFACLLIHIFPLCGCMHVCVVVFSLLASFEFSAVVRHQALIQSALARSGARRCSAFNACNIHTCIDCMTDDPVLAPLLACSVVRSPLLLAQQSPAAAQCSPAPAVDVSGTEHSLALAFALGR